VDDGEHSVERLESYNKALAQQLGADHCHNIDRIMRLPGTTNLPDAKKRALGRRPVAAELIYLDLDRRYRLDDFPASANANGRAGAANGNGRGTSLFDPGQWITELLRIGHDPNNPQRWGGDRSKAVFAAACELVSALWDDEAIAEALFDPQHGISAHVRGQQQPRNYALHQARQARKAVAATRPIVDGKTNGHATTAPPPWEHVELEAWARSGQPIPERQWIMEDWIPRGQTTGLYGVSGVLKTTFLLQLMMAASAGLTFCGLPIAEVAVYGLFCEDTKAEILRRAARLARFYQRDLDRFPNFHFASLVGQMDTELLSFDLGRRHPGPASDHFAQELDYYRPGLVVHDTLPDFFGGEEINRRQTSQFIRMLDGIGMLHNCAIVCAAHSSMRGRASGRLDSGNTGIEGKMRARLTLHDPGAPAEDNETPDERAYRPQPHRQAHLDPRQQQLRQTRRNYRADHPRWRVLSGRDQSG
jgi:hypothetical protein